MNETVSLENQSVELLVSQVTDEFMERLDRGEQPEVEEYASRHPRIAKILRQVLPALQALRAPAMDAVSSSDMPAVEAPPLGCLGDYRLVREIGRGGMGVVYEAEQISLGRRVALKVLPFAAALDSRQLQRFKNEAHAAAQLHHTNIVPVYAVGCDRGVHFFAMQFIEGQTLAALIGELQRQHPGRKTEEKLPDPQPTGPYTPPPLAPSSEVRELRHELGAALQGEEWQPRLALPSKVGEAPAADTVIPPVGVITTEHSSKDPGYFRTVTNLGVQAAEALEHAHQLGVIHRDIKPANLLVDIRGNLWVTDFGLAQIQSDTRLTLTGDLVGTLRYMSPEQALAKRVIVDHRTDIYSLGATLYEMLTLGPIFEGHDRQELLRQIAFEEPRPPRKHNPAIPVELETIILKALAKNPNERYATSQELADDLRRFLDDRPILAKRPSLVQRVRKWARRHQAVVWSGALASAAVLLIAVILLAVSNARITQEVDEKELAVQEKDREKQRADQNLDRAKKTVRDYLVRVASDPRLRGTDLHGLRRDLLTLTVPLLKEFARQDGNDRLVRAERGWAFYQLGVVSAEIGAIDQALSNFRQAQAIYGGLATDFPKIAYYREQLAESHNYQGVLMLAQDRLGAAEKAFRQAKVIQEKLVSDFPKVAVFSSNLGGAVNNLSNVARKQGDRQAVRRLLLQAIAHQRTAEKLDAAASPRKARQYKAWGEFLAGHYNNLGVVLDELGESEAAEKAHLQALSLFQALVAASATNPKYRAGVASCYNNLGICRSSRRQFAGAAKSHREAAKIQEKLVAEFPSHPSYARALAGSQHNLGLALKNLGKLSEAEHAIRRAVELRQQLVKRFPRMSDYRKDLADSHDLLGLVLCEQRHWAQSEAEFRSALSLRKKLGRQPNLSANSALKLGASYIRLGVLHLTNRSYEPALEWLSRAISRLEPLQTNNPYKENARVQLRNAHGARAEVLIRMSRFSEALKDWDRCLDLDDRASPNAACLDPGASEAARARHGRGERVGRQRHAAELPALRCRARLCRGLRCSSRQNPTGPGVRRAGRGAASPGLPRRL